MGFAGCIRETRECHDVGGNQWRSRIGGGDHTRFFAPITVVLRCDGFLPLRPKREPDMAGWPKAQFEPGNRYTIAACFASLGMTKGHLLVPRLGQRNAVGQRIIAGPTRGRRAVGGEQVELQRKRVDWRDFEFHLQSRR